MKKINTITIINDCRDDNARGRQLARVQGLFGVSANFIGVKNDIEAAGNLIDTLDAIGDANGLILVNVAPRHGKAKKWKNGTPFGYFLYRNCIIISTIDGYTLSLAKKLHLFEEIHVFEFEKNIDEFVKSGLVHEEDLTYLKKTQFRSFDFSPRCAYQLTQGNKTYTQKLNKEKIADCPDTVWWVDNFGNCKTTLFEAEIKHSNFLKSLGKVSVFDRLKDVPDHTAALIVGSSGIENNRFVEIVVQGASAQKTFALHTGENSV